MYVREGCLSFEGKSGWEEKTKRWVFESWVSGLWSPVWVLLSLVSAMVNRDRQPLKLQPYLFCCLGLASILPTKTRAEPKPKTEVRAESPPPCASRLHLLGEVAVRRKTREGRRGEVPKSDQGSSDPPADIAPSLSRSRIKRQVESSSFSCQFARLAPKISGVWKRQRRLTT